VRRTHSRRAKAKTIFFLEWERKIRHATEEQTEGVIRGRSGAVSRLILRTLAEAKREHISEVLQMTNGLIAGKGAER
jgi:hypothetical protein